MAVIAAGEVVSCLAIVTIVDQQSVMEWTAAGAVKRQNNVESSGHGAADSLLQKSRGVSSDFSAQSCSGLH